MPACDYCNNIIVVVVYAYPICMLTLKATINIYEEIISVLSPASFVYYAGHQGLPPVKTVDCFLRKIIARTFC